MAIVSNRRRVLVVGVLLLLFYLLLGPRNAGSGPRTPSAPRQATNTGAGATIDGGVPNSLLPNWIEKKLVAFPKLAEIEHEVEDGIRGFENGVERAAHHVLAGLGGQMEGEGGGCVPGKRIVYLKTHKTGSSTLTNIFHRFAHKTKARVVLPASDLFLGWPNKNRIATSYVDIPGGDHYDVFCSAHAVYDGDVIDKIVPDAEHVTVLREPAKHFISSWNYWGTAAHIKQKSGMDVTYGQVIDDPGTWWPRGLRSDRDLLQNSQGFDLGIEHDASSADVDAAIARLDSWTLVMITEYMDESLVLWKRKMCWTLDDVAYFALKVNNHKKKPAIPEDVRAKIYSMNWIDARLYTHFNASLWEQIGKEANFTEEVQALKALKADIAERCQATADWDEDQHRKWLLGELGPVTDDAKKCHLLQLDSGGFVKYLKKVSGVPKLECHRQGRPIKAYAFQPISGTGANPIVTTLHRYAALQGLRPALPADLTNFSYGWPSNEALPRSVANIPTKFFKMRQPGTGRQSMGFDVLVSAPFRAGGKVDEVVKNVPQVGLLRSPLERFVALWNDPNFATRRQRWPDAPRTLKSFLARADELLPKIPADDRHELVNGQAFALGWDPESSVGGEQFAGQLHSKFSQINGVMLIAEYMDTSLVLLRRFMCWQLDLISQPYLATPPHAGTADLSPAEVAKILALNSVDVDLYKTMNATFWRRLELEIDISGELDQLRAARADNTETCAVEAKASQQQMVDTMLEHVPKETFGVASAMQENGDLNCYTYLVEPKGFAIYLMKVWHIRSSADIAISSGGAGKAHGASCSAGPTQQFIYLKTHKTGSSTLTNIFHRYILKHNLRAVLPIDNMYLGWPNADRVGKSFTPVPGVTTYDALCSGHAIWSHKWMRELVPIGRQVTVLRNPIAHFYSSWNHWHPNEHIVAMGGPTVTMDQFLDEPDKYWEYAKWSDKSLMWNSFSFDLGIGNNPDQAAIDGLIHTLQHDFDLVLITEFMDESLIMLKDTFCWAMEDILHYSLKVTHTHPSEKKKGPTAKQIPKIARLEHSDVQLYAALNTTFHEKLAKQGPQFHADLKEFRDRKAEIYDRCGHLEQYEEDKHRKQLLEGGKLTPEMRECHTMLLDSKGFVKVMKRNLGIQTRECTTVSVYPMKHLALVLPRGVDAAILTNFAYRGAVSHRLATLVPRPTEDDQPAAAIDWEKPAELKELTASTNPRKGPQVMAEMFTKYDRPVLDATVPGEYFIAVFQDPVDHFAVLWDAVSAEPGGGAVSIDDFLASPGKYTSKAPYDRLKPNPQLYDVLGVRGDIQPNMIIRQLDASFRLVLDAGRVVDSLILLRRMICWDRPDIVDYRIPSVVHGSPKYRAARTTAEGFSKAAQDKIRDYSALDGHLHTHASDDMDARIGRELAWEEELKESTQWNMEAASMCTPLARVPQSAMLKTLLEFRGPIPVYPLNTEACYLQLLEPATFYEYLRQTRRK